YDPAYITNIRQYDLNWMYPGQDIALDISAGTILTQLLSVGPFDLAPGNELPIVLAFVMGENFHTNPRNLANIYRGDIDAYYANLDFSDLIKNAQWARWIYDNPGIDTDNDGILDDWFSGIWVINVNTGVKKPFFRHFGDHDWHPDKNKFVIRISLQIYTVDVIIIDPPLVVSLSIKQITNEGKILAPEWSFDGKWIAFRRHGLTKDSLSNGIWIIDENGNNEKRVSNKDFGGPEWHPSKNEILIMGGKDDKIKGEILYTYSLDNDQVTPFMIIENGSLIGHPKFSPDGMFIGYAWNPKTAPAVWMTDIWGYNKRPLSTEWGKAFAWSPNGRKIIFVPVNQFDLIEGNGDLWIINRDGSGLKQLTFVSDKLLK
ncbi:PD40 domain-containing protein, partial [candidate division KSB1 bacterium]|nr:PD40 domain-containing protein [candidate division KSB1 bacterium]